MLKTAQDEVRTLGQAIAILEDAIDTDSSYWELVAIGQDTAAAEASGYLAGFRDALSAAHTLLAADDPTTLQSYLAAVQDTAIELREEMDGEI